MTHPLPKVNELFKMEYNPANLALIKAAKRIYRTYKTLHSKTNRQPQGVAIHRDSHRGQLIFRTNPILLPGETFISLQQLESEA